MSRRSVLVGGSAAVGLGALASAGVGALVGRDVQASRAEVTAQLAGATYAERAAQAPAAAAFPQLGTPTYLTSNADFYRIDTALRIPTLSAADWQLRVHGMVERELTLSFADLIGRPLVERPITLTCVSNPVGGDLISTANFIGVPLRDILLEAGLDPAADQLFSRSTEGFYTGTPTSVVMEPQRGALLAIGMNGEALPPEHGFPVRMVVPGLYGYVSATKWVVDIEATTFADPLRRGFWFERGWSRLGPIKTMARIDAPRGSAPSLRAPSPSRASPGRSTPGSRRSRCARTAGPGRPRRSRRGLGGHLADVARRAGAPGGQPHRRGARHRQERLRADRTAGRSDPERRQRLAERQLHREPRLTACGAPNGGPDATTGRPRPGGFVSTIGVKIATLCLPSQAATVERGCRQDPNTGRFRRPHHPRDRRGEPVTVEALPRREATA